MADTRGYEVWAPRARLSKVLTLFATALLPLLSLAGGCSSEPADGGQAGSVVLAGTMATAGTVAGTPAGMQPMGGMTTTPTAGIATAGTMVAGTGTAGTGAVAGSMAGVGAMAGTMDTTAGTMAGTMQTTAGTMAGTGSAGMDTAGMDAAGMDAAGMGSTAMEEVNVAVQGPHTYDTFTEGAKAPEYAEGLVYYPTDADGPFPVMILSPGLTADNTDYEIWGEVLASHAIVALLMQPTSTGDWNDARAVDLQAALGVVRGSLNDSGPLAGKLDTANVGFMGQSMGGGGTLIAANDVGDEIQAAIPMEPYAPGASFPNITAPILIIAAENDTVASVSSNAFAHYNSIPDSTIKIYMEGKGADHYYSTDRYADDFDMNARYGVAFIKVYLEGDSRYQTYLYGDEHEAVSSETSRYLTSQ